MNDSRNRKKIGYRGIGIILGLLLHVLVVLALVLCSADVAKVEEDKIVSVKLASIPMEAAPIPEPEPPKPEAPKTEPEPPKPAPEPPKPEPEPPKPEPPKPAPEPPKPAPQKTAPKTAAQKPKPRTPSLAERLQSAPTVRNENRSSRRNDNLRRLLDRAKRSSGITSHSSSSNVSSGGATSSEIANYAEQVVKPYILNNWIQPVSGELDVSVVRPVTIGFTVYSGGSISNARIVRASNSRVMNESVRNMLAGMTRLPALSTVGISSSKLDITVEVCLSR